MKRVFILSGQSMFGQGIETLLVQNKTVDIIGMETDINCGVDFIHRHRPDVVIINCEKQDLDYGPAFVCILQERLDICVVCLDLESNQMYVYQGEQKQVHNVEDLLEVIQD